MPTPTRRTFLKQLSLSTGGLFLAGAPSFSFGAAPAGLPRALPETQGVSSAGIQAFLDAVAKTKFEFHSFMMVRHGHVVAEGWWNPYAPNLRHTLYSMSKSFTSTAVGFAVSEGLLHVDDRVISFFPNDLPPTVSEPLAGLRVRDLLSMSVGNEKEPTQAVVLEENWVKTFLAAPITHPPGTQFMYNSAATYMLSAIVQTLTGKTVLEYLRPRLFEPLGIEGATWETCPRGINTGGWGLSVHTEDLAKFGQLYLQKGQWNGRQILPARWVEEATSFKIQQPAPAKPARPNEKNDWLQGYAFQFWRCQHGAFRGDGAFGQFTIVLPEQDAVIAINSECSNMQGQLDLVWEHLLPAFNVSALAAEPAAQALLQKTLADLALPLPTGAAAPALAARISGKTFTLDSNAAGLAGASFEFGENRCRFTLRDAQEAFPFECGFGKWIAGSTALPGTPPRLISGGAPKPGAIAPVTASAQWKNETTLELTWRYPETPHHDTVTCVFEAGDRLTISLMNSIAAMSATPRDKRPALIGRLVS